MKKKQSIFGSNIFLISVVVLTLVIFILPLGFRLYKASTDAKYAIGDVVEIDLGHAYSNCNKKTFVSDAKKTEEGWTYEVGCVNCPFSENGWACLNLNIREDQIVRKIRSVEPVEWKTYENDSD